MPSTTAAPAPTRNGRHPWPVTTVIMPTTKQAVKLEGPLGKLRPPG